MHNLTISLQALVAASVFFVWVIRYANIVQEFKQYGLPDWLRGPGWPFEDELFVDVVDWN